MKITETSLRKLVRKELFKINEEEQKPGAEKPGSEKADTKGTLDVKKIASTLGVDADKLASAVKAAKSGSRSSSHNAIFGDVFVKLMEADPSSTVTVMNVLKKVTADTEKK